MFEFGEHVKEFKNLTNRNSDFETEFCMHFSSFFSFFVEKLFYGCVLRNKPEFGVYNLGKLYLKEEQYTIKDIIPDSAHFSFSFVLPEDNMQISIKRLNNK